MAATNEIRLQRLEDKLNDLADTVNGGTNTSWDRSLRGRVHYLSGQDAAQKQLLAAGSRRFTRNEKLAMLAFVGFGLFVQVASLTLIAFGIHG